MKFRGLKRALHRNESELVSVAAAVSALQGEDTTSAVDVERLLDLAIVRENGIEKSALDNRTYSSFRLKNGLQVLLICDPKLEKSAAALSVKVGNHSDPPEIPGLAHFLEHMLFLGTEKYPEESEYSTFLSDHGGINNAFTTAEETNFHFDVMSDYFYEALDRFSQFFISPLLKMDTANRELQAVDNEFSRSLHTDAQRMWHVFKSLSNPEHPFSRFGMGNSTTLNDTPKREGIDVHAALLEFYETYYSANRMKLVLIGRDSLSVLEEYCRDLFINIPNRNTLVPYPYPHPKGQAFSPAELGKRIDIVPIRDIRSINILFPTYPVTYDRKSNVRGNGSKPKGRNPKVWHTYGASSYMAHMMSREDPGSILSYLRKRQWANSVSASTSSSFSDFSVFSITIACTDTGITEHVSDIVESVFAYLNIIRDAGALKWYFDEISALSAIKFRFKSDEHPFSCATIRASRLHDYPINKILSASWIEPSFDQEAIETMIDALTPEKCLLIVMHKSFDGKVDLQEQWYNASYSVRDLDARLIESIAKGPNKEALDHLKMPVPNQFIPENFDLLPFEKPEALQMKGSLKKNGTDKMNKLQYHSTLVRKAGLNDRTIALTDLCHTHIEDKRKVALATVEKNLLEQWEGKDDVWRPPALIQANDNSLLWIKQDTTFLRPETTVRLLLKSSRFSESPLQHLKTLLYINLIDDCLSESNYPAAVSGLNYTRGIDSCGFGITVLGYSDKIERYFEFIVSSFRDTSGFEEGLFNRIKENVSKSLSNERKNSPLSHAQKKLYHICQNNIWTAEEKLAHLENITLQEIKDQEQYIFAGAQLELFAYGNVSIQQSQQLLQTAESYFGCDRSGSEVSFPRTANFDARKQYIYVEHCQDHENPNSAVIVSFQLEPVSPPLQAFCAILEQFSHEIFFHQLRTNEQLGYICYASHYSINGILHFKFCIQSNSKDPIYMNDRIEQFIHSWGDRVDSLDETQFENLIHSFINNTLQEKRNMQSEEGYWYASIENGLYDFTFRIETAHAAAGLTLEDFRELYHQYFPWAAPNRKKIVVGTMAKNHAIQLFGEDYDEIMENKESEGFGSVLDGYLSSEAREHGEVVHVSTIQDVLSSTQFYPPNKELIQ